MSLSFSDSGLRRARRGVAVVALCLLSVMPAVAQMRTPGIGYLFPAGGQRGTTFQVTVGGQALRKPKGVSVTGKGIRVKVVRYTGSTRFFNPQQRFLLLERLWELEELHLKRTVRVNTEIKAIQAQQRRQGAWKTLDREVDTEGYKLPNHHLLVNLESRSLRELMHIQNQLSFPRNKLQLNRQLAEHVVLEVTIDPRAERGVRELRLQTAAGTSNPMRFHVGALPERLELEPNTTVPDELVGRLPTLARHFPLAALAAPVVVNGQIMPGDVDRFRLQARKGDQLDLRVSARELIPFLADAVPGWFQAVLAVHDAEGRELAYVDDSGISPDPVLRVAIPADGDYTVTIRDAIYRGRQDFVYRLAISDAAARVRLSATVPPPPVDLLPQPSTSLQSPREREPNNSRARAEKVALPHVLEGLIGTPGDVDVYRVTGRAGSRLVAEVYARREGSPMDALLRLRDDRGKVLAWNDDHVLKEQHLHIDHTGVTTHHADAYLTVELPRTGTYFVEVSDAQQHGGDDYRYRLRLGPPSPDYALRGTPSMLSAPRRGVVPVTVYALRQDGFDGEIELALKGAPEGMVLTGGVIPAGASQARMTVTMPTVHTPGPVSLQLVGVGKHAGRVLRRSAVPADNVMQAFLWRHLAPAQAWSVSVTKGWSRVPLFMPLSARGVRISAERPGSVRLQTRQAFKRKARDRVFLRLDQPPPGISLDQESVHIGAGEWRFDLVLDKTEGSRESSGNVLVQVMREFTPKGKAETVRKQEAMGYLPAIAVRIEI